MAVLDVKYNQYICGIVLMKYFPKTGKRERMIAMWVLRNGGFERHGGNLITTWRTQPIGDLGEVGRIR